MTSKCLPSVLIIDDKFMPIEDYVQTLTEVGKSVALVSNIRGLATLTLIVNTPKDAFFILHEIRHIFLVKPTFTKYTEMVEIYRRVIKISIPEMKRWEELLDLLD